MLVLLETNNRAAVDFMLNIKRALNTVSLISINSKLLCMPNCIPNRQMYMYLSIIIYTITCYTVIRFPVITCNRKVNLLCIPYTHLIMN